MTQWRAVNPVAREVVEYEAEHPLPEHLLPPWQVSEVRTLPPSPGEPLSPPGPVRITKFAFRSRFTANEKIAIELASLDVPGGTLDARAAAAQVRVWLADIEAAQFIDLSAARTRGGVQGLEDYGLLTAGRAAAVLDTPPTADEVF